MRQWWETLNTHLKTVEGIDYMMGTRIYRVHSIKEYIPRIINLFGRQIKCVYTSQPEYQEFLNRKRAQTNDTNTDLQSDKENTENQTDTQSDNDKTENQTDTDQTQGEDDSGNNVNKEDNNTNIMENQT